MAELGLTHTQIPYLHADACSAPLLSGQPGCSSRQKTEKWIMLVESQFSHLYNGLILPNSQIRGNHFVPFALALAFLLFLWALV